MRTTKKKKKQKHAQHKEVNIFRFADRALKNAPRHRRVGNATPTSNMSCERKHSSRHHHQLSIKQTAINRKTPVVHPSGTKTINTPLNIHYVCT